MARRTSTGRRGSLAVAELVDLAREAIFLVDRDPLEDLDSLLQLGDLVAKAVILNPGVAIIAAAAAAAAPPIGTSDPGFENRGDHHDRDDPRPPSFRRDSFRLYPHSQWHRGREAPRSERRSQRRGR